MPKKSRDTQAKEARPAEDKKPGWLERLKRLRIRFKREGISVHVLLEDPAQHIADIKRQSVQADVSEATALRNALKEVLDRHASARTVLPHLGLLEKALNKHGLKALDKLPAEVMQKALSQLETLVNDWSQGNLAALRARLTTALVKHGRAKGHRRAAARLSDFQDSKRLQVEEASHSTFLAVNAQWKHSRTGGRA